MILLLFVLLLSVGQVWGQNKKCYPCDSVFVIDSAVYTGRGVTVYERGHMVRVPCFTIKDVDRYLAECYADSSVELTLSADKKASVKNEKELAHFLWTHRDGPVWAREVIHRKPSFDDFKKWLKRK